MGLIEGTGGGTSYKPPPVVRRRTVVSRPKAGSDDAATRPWTSPVTPAIAAGRVGQSAFSPPPTPAAAPVVDTWVPAIPADTGGQAGSTGPGQMTSVTDSSQPQPGDPAAQKQLQDLEDLRMKALDTQLEAIAANFGMTREQLDADMTKTGDDWRAAKAGLMRQAMQQHQSNLDAMAERGIIQSGQRIKGDLRIEEDEATRLTEATRARDYQKAQLAAQLAALAPQQAAEEASARLGSQRSKLDLETMRALAG